MPDLVSKAKFALRLGVSAPYINKICSDGKLTLINDGKAKLPKIDLMGSATLEFLKRREAANPRPKVKNKQTSKPADNKQESSHTENASTQIADVYKLKDRNTELKNEQLEIKISQDRGDLVRKNLSTSVFSGIYNIHENQFKAISVKTNPKTEQIYTSEYQSKADELVKEFKLKDTSDTKTSILKILNAGESERSRALTEIMEDETSSILKNIQFEIDRFLVMMKTTNEN